jgi:hypothetical protein
MTDAIKLDRDQIISRATYAKQFLDTEMAKRVFSEVRADLSTAWQATAAGERDRREEYYAMLLGVSAFEAKLDAWVQDGVKAQADIDAENRDRAVSDINRSGRDRAVT